MSTRSCSHLCEQQGGHQPFGISYEEDGGNGSQRDIPDRSSPNQFGFNNCSTFPTMVG